MRTSFCVLLFICLINNKTNAQSLGDTQIWIKSTIENYQDKSLNNGRIWVYYSGEDIWFTKLEPGGFFQYEIKLKDLNQVVVKKNEDGNSISLGCILSKRCCELTHHVATETGSVVKVSSDAPKYNCEIYLTKALSEDNLPNRLKKALVHLITLHGGKVLSDTF
jgi:hypothetical protein